MINFNLHTFHLVEERPWPLSRSIRAFFTTLGLVEWFNLLNPTLLIIGLLRITLSMAQWWRDVRREGNSQGHHPDKVEYGLRWGIVLFIVSEVLFFFSFFWAFFHRRLSPTLELGLIWPPIDVKVFNPFRVPLLNTAILLASGVTVTWAHHSLIAGYHTEAWNGLALTVCLGFYFTLIQLYEYIEASFSISDSVYGSRFFVATGFHGLHVIIGSSFLIVTLLRLSQFCFSPNHHFGFEAAAWYWHFVDVVWLFLYVSIYWWGR